MKKYVIKNRAPGGFNIDYEQELNPEQYEAVASAGGANLVLAGAGTGKTRTVTYRVARLIESGVRPEAILLVTFTNKAAREMLQRVEAVLKAGLHGLWGGTFHHIGNLILRRHAGDLGYKANYSILDREDARDLLDTCVGDMGIDRKKWNFPKADVLQTIIGLSENTGETLEQVVVGRQPHFLAMIADIARVAERYSSRKLELNLMDFDDLLVNWLRLMEEQPAVRERYTEKFQHVLVDEYQDTNYVQARIVDMMASRHGNVFVVGDDAQSIYSFRGANFENIISFPKRFPDARLFRLTTNYRSIPQVLELANESIRHNRRQFPKELHAVRPDGETPSLLPLRDVYQQAQFVVQRIMDLYAEGKPFSEMAVLYRSHYHSMEIQMEMTKHGVPFEIRSGLRFFEQAHVKDVTAYLRIVVNPFDELAWARVLKLMPGVGKVTARRITAAVFKTSDPLAALIEGAADKLIRKSSAVHFDRFIELMVRLREKGLTERPSEMIRLVVNSGYEEILYATYANASVRAEDIEQLAEYAGGYSSCEELLSELALLSTVGEEGDDDAFDGDRVILSSIHQAKGLEWSAVFMVWLCEGRFPSAKSGNRQEDEEEERRLFYVAVTRARDDLYLCYPASASGYSGLTFFSPSRFISELPEKVYERCDVEERY